MSTGKGKKRVKDTPFLYDERKKRHPGLLTDTTGQKLTQIYKKRKISISEIIEEWAQLLDCN